MRGYEKKNQAGFTLAELLIVVAIIAVLVAIAIPLFSTQLEKSKEATDLANIRAAYAEVTAAFIEDGQACSRSVSMKSNRNDCVTTSIETLAGVSVEDILTGNDPCVVAVDEAGEVTIDGNVTSSEFVTNAP